MLHEWKKKQDTELFCFHSILQSEDYKLEKMEGQQGNSLS